MPGGCTSRFLLPFAVLLLAAACPPAWASNEDWRLEARLDKAQAYPGEPVRLTVSFLVGQVSLRNIQYPRLDRDGFGPGEFSAPLQTRLRRDDRDYLVHTFTTTLTPRASGKLEIGPVELGFDLLAPRAMTARAAPLQLRVLPLPARGRPAEFTGAVGQFRVTREVEPKRIRSGDAVTLRTRIQGNDAAKRFSCPSLDLPGTRGYPPRDRRARNVLLCEQVLLVDAMGDLSIPAASIQFFDPRTGRYATASSAPLRLEVAPPPANKPPPASTPPPPTARLGDTSATPLGYAFAGLAAFLVWLIWRRLASRRRQNGAGTKQDAMHQAHDLPTLESALRDADPMRFYAEAHRIAQRIAAERLKGKPAGITAADLESATGDSEDMTGLAELLHECDAVRYGNAAPDMPRLRRQLRSACPDARTGRD